MIKKEGKSMASGSRAELHYLAERGIDCIESDMGEYIVCSSPARKPSHIVMPAIYARRAGDIASVNCSSGIPRHALPPRRTMAPRLIQTGRAARLRRRGICQRRYPACPA
ncbi:hypothetical protein ACU4GD_24825 [Cupriavidus basilensis]